MVQLKLKLKLMRKGLVPKQLDLFQDQSKTVHVPGLSFLGTQNGLSGLEVTHSGGTSSSRGSVEIRALALCGIICSEHPGLPAQAPRTCKNKS